MRLFALLLAVGLAAGSGKLTFRDDQEYEFSYEGRLLTGIPELSQTHYAGVGIKATVQLQVQQDGTYAISVQNPRFTKVNDDKLRSNQDQVINWRNIVLPGYSQVPSGAEQQLRKPATFKMSTEDGSFQHMRVSADEPAWSVNFKKAIVVLFQTKSLNLNHQETQNNMIGSDNNNGQEPRNFWQTVEQSLDGECDVSYQVNELPEQVIRQQPELLPSGRACSQKYYEIVRSRDLSSCGRRNIYSFYKPGYFRCQSAGDCEGMWIKSSVTRYIACGPREDLKVQTIINEGEMERAINGAKTEKIVTGAKQTLKLQQTRPKQQQIGEPSGAVTLQTLEYEFESPEQQQQQQQQQQGQSGQQRIAKFKSLKRALVESGEISQQQLQDQLKEQIKRVISELIDNDLQNLEDLPKKQITMKAISLAGAFSILHKDNIEQVYQQLKQQYSNDQEKQQTFKNVFFDSAIMGGNYNNVMFIKEKIEANELNRYQIASIFVFLPSYIMTPTEEVLDAILELIQSRPISQEPLVYSQAILGYSQLVHNACVAKNRKTSYPTAVYGEFCAASSASVERKLLPFLQQELHSAQSAEKRSLILVAMGTLAHESALPSVLPVLDGSFQTASGQPVTQQERMLALYATARIGEAASAPETVEPMIFAVLNNQAEHTEMRVAAFNSLLRLNPRTSYLHRIASLSYREKNPRVLQAINTAFFTLAAAGEKEPLQNKHTSLPRKAWLIYPLVKKTGNRVPSAATIINNDYMQSLGLGYHGASAYYYGQGEGSYLPTNFYHKMVLLLNRYQVTPVEIAGRLVNGENLIQQLVETLTPGSSHMTKKQFAQKVQQNLGSEWKQIIEQLNIKPESENEDEEMGNVEASFYLKMFEKSPIYHSLKSKNSQELKQKLESVLLQGGQNLRDSICGEHQVNMQRLMNYMPSESAMPSEIGLPIIVETHAPSVFSIKGKINVQCGNGIVPSIQVQLRKLQADQKITYIGTVLPFSEEYAFAVVDEQSVVNAPVQIEAQYDATQHQLQIKAKADQQNQQSGGPIDVAQFHVKPYTVTQKTTNLQPFSKNPSAKIIHSKSQQKQLSQRFGADSLGLDLQAILKTESATASYRNIVDKINLLNNNPLNLLRFPFSASGALSEKKTPSLRYHEFQLKFDQSNSATKEIDFKLKLGAASKVAGEPIKYHKVEDVQSSQQEMESTYPQWKKLLPLKIVSRPIGEQTEHQGRQDKLKQAMEKIGLDQGTAVNIAIETTFVGSARPKTFSYQGTFAYGSPQQQQQSQIQSKWNLEFSGSQSNSKYCVRGNIEMPNVPEWKVQDLRSRSLSLQYSNVFGYGNNNNCEQQQIKITGNGRVSDKQKQWSQQSPEGQKYEQLKQSGAPMTELSEIAEIVRRQASTFDELDVSIEYVNVQGQVIKYSQYAHDAIKALLWPYSVQQRADRPQGQSGSGTNQWNLRFNQQSNTVDISLNAANGEKIKFSNIHLPYAVSYFYPENAIDKASSKISGPAPKLFYPSCKVEGKWLSTFSNQTVQHHLDECFHLMSADASFRKQFAVLMRKTSSSQSEDSPKEIKVLLGKTVIELTPSDSHSMYSSNIKVKVNGSEIQEPNNGQLKPIKDSQGNLIAEVFKTQDKVIKLQMLYCPIVQGPTVIVSFDGQKMKVEASGVFFKSLTGMCGDLSGPKASPSVGPDGCVYSTSQTYAASNRASSGQQCGGQQSLHQEVRSLYQQEKSRCQKAKPVHTKLSKSYGYPSTVGSGSCTKFVHQIIEKQSRICFSRKPVTDCGEGCQPSDTSRKNVSFACLPKGRTANRYAEKVRQGEILPELERLPEAFSITYPQPRNCVRRNN